MASPLYDAIDFMQSFGMFDIVLPFLLVFTVVFGILEKTRVFGTEDGKSDGPPKKNINAMVAFTIGFFVVAATQVVTIMQTALPIIILLLVMIIAFMVLYGAMMSEGEVKFLAEGSKAKGAFVFGIFIAVIAIVLGAMGMLGDLVNLIFQNIGGPALSTVLLLLVIAGFMWYVMKEDKTKTK